MHSCVYEGRVRHSRVQPFNHGFSYPLFMLYLDLSEIPTLFKDRWFWSLERFNLATFRRADYLGDPSISLEEEVRNRIQRASGTAPNGPIRLLTHLRYFGYCFNPVSFYYCFDEKDSALHTIVAEVTNTPWNERHAYVLSRNQDLGDSPDRMHFRFAKDFHVSPFMDMDQNYDWHLSRPEKSLHVHIANSHLGDRVFEADLKLVRKEISAATLARLLLSYPPMTMKVGVAIYWQALRLRLKGARFYTHPTETVAPKRGPQE